MENRSHKGTVEVRANAEGQPMIVGYAAVFNRRSSDLGFIEQVDPRAFDKTLVEADVRGLGNHDVNWLLGRSKASTLRLSVDSIGLQYEIDVNEADPDGVRAVEKVRRGDWDGSSFSFQAIRDEWNWEATPPERRLLEVSLIDVGPVTFPAYPDATATSRALEPIAAKVGRPVQDLVTAMQTGEIRSMLQPATEPRAAGDAVTIAWGPEEGFNDLISDVNAQLNPAGGWRYYALDAAVTLDKVLVADWEGCCYWVAPITIAAAGEPEVAPFVEWTAVEQGWIVSDDSDDDLLERSLGALREARAGKVLSAKTKGHIMAAYTALRDLLAQAKEDDSIDSAKEEDAAEIDAEKRLTLDEMDRELRLLDLAA